MTSKIFTAMHTKLGGFVAGKQNGWRENYTTAGTYVLVDYDSHFEKGPAKESFTFLKNGNRFELVGYNVNSPLLITG